MSAKEKVVRVRAPLVRKIVIITREEYDLLVVWAAPKDLEL